MEVIVSWCDPIVGKSTIKFALIKFFFFVGISVVVLLILNDCMEDVYKLKKPLLLS